MATTGTEVFGGTVGRYEETDAPKGLLLPHKLGSVLWAPMAIMGLMLVLTAFGLAIARAQLAVDLSEEVTALRKANFETIGYLIPSFMFLGFALILAGVSFVIARILGVFRRGGGDTQAAIGKGIKTPDMPMTAWVFLSGMMMAMMILLFTFAGGVYAAVQAHDAWITSTSAGVPGNEAALARAETWGTWLDGLRRFGVGLYLGSIAFGLAAIIKAIRFQTLRIKELADERASP